MPMPKPKQGEKKQDFIDRCMSDSVMQDEHPDSDERYSVCQDLWEEGRSSGKQLTVRNLSLRLRQDGTPESLDEDNRSVAIVAATEQPVTVLDMERMEIVDEVLLMSGAKFAQQVPLLDSHMRFDTQDVLGSAKEFSVNGSELQARAYFSSVQGGEDALTKVREGHLTDFSVGYSVEDSVFVEEGTTATVDGREFTGPVRVTTGWTVREVSIVPIGADQRAKARNMTATKRSDHQEEEGMDKRLRTYLEKRGLDQNATEQQAWEFLARLEEQDQQARADGQQGQGGGDHKREPDADPDQVRTQVQKEERERVSEIHSLAQRFGCEDMAGRAVQDGTDVATFRKQVLDAVEQQQSQAQPGFRAEMGRTDSEKFRGAAEDAVLIRGGIVDKSERGGEDLAGFTLREMARECLRRSGARVPSNPMEMVGRALTSDDFPKILSDTANKALFSGWETAEETWDTWCGVGSVSDFKPHTMVRAGELDDLDEIPKEGEYKYSDLSEEQEEYQIATFGKLFAISRQAIINDDVGALVDIPAKRGEAAARKIGDIAYSVLTANSAMGDGVALFHDDHNNLLSGTDMTVANISAAIEAMKKQYDVSGKRRLNIRPRYFIAPVAKEGAAEQFFKTNLIGGKSDQPNLENPYAGNYFTRVYEPRLDDDSASVFYLAGPKRKTVMVFFLNQVRAPYLETRQGWNVDGVEYKVRLDAGAKAVDWRGLTKNS